jgi:N-acetylmuramoyl-L-alanine amidase
MKAINSREIPFRNGKKIFLFKWLRPKLFKNTEQDVRTFLVLLISAVIIFTPLHSGSSKRNPGNKITCVVIDAGHGGHDSGCLGNHSREKDVALAIALRLGKFIETNFKEVKVVYTRKSDKFIGLDERAEIANKNKADLFICIHCNSGAKAAYGIETYVMGLHKTEENLAVAKRENSVVILEKDYKKKYEGFDPDSPEGNIIFSMYQNAFLEQSLKISTLIQNESADFAGRHNRGVKQAGFLVLFKTTMPSLLIETGFLTNPQEERFMISKEGQDKIAYAIYRAFSFYKSGNDEAAKKEVPGKPDDMVEKKLPVNQDTTSVSKPVIEMKKEVKTETKEVKNHVVVIAKDTVAATKPEVKAETPVKEIKTYKDWKEKSDSNTQVNPKPAPDDKPVNVDTEEIYFTIQIATSGKLLPKNSELLKGEKDILTDKVNGLYKFMTGKYSTLEEALKKNRVLRAEKFKDAFVVAYHNGQRITITEAQALLKKN